MTPALSPDQWGLAWQLFQAASELPAAQRLSFLDTHTNDPAVIRHVLELLEDSDGNADPPPPVERSGTEVGHYRVGERIGRGGMGEVYEAVDLQLDRQVAIKFLPGQVLSDERAVRRFLAEAKAASALNHPNLVTVHEFIRQDGVLAIVMERIEGQTLRARLPGSGVAPPDARREFPRPARQLAEALAAAHERGIIHRDLKPENIMVRADGYVKILDFGLAVLGASAVTNVRGSAAAFSTLAGTPRYMSPEQKRSEALTPASDVYALGIVFLEMLAGAPDLTLLPELTRRLPGPLARLLNGMLNEDPVKRPSAAEVARQLSGLSPERQGHLLWYAALLVAALGLGTVVWKTRQPVATPAPELVVEPLTTLPGEEYGVSFSPDGERVVFAWDGERQDNLDLYVMTIRGRTLRRLTAHPKADAYPAWSPDGKTIAFGRVTGLGQVTTYLIPAEGGEERAIGNSGMLERLSDWSPDSQWLVVQDASPNGVDRFGLNLISARTGENRLLIRPPAGGHYGAPAFSPDGRHIAFVREFGGTSDLAILRLTPDLHPAGGPLPLRIADFRAEVCASPRWTRDNRAILFTFNRGGNDRLWQVSVPNSLAEPVTPTLVPLGDGVEFAAISPAGNRLAFTRRVWDDNLWRIPLPKLNERAGQPRPLISSTRTERYPDVSRDGRIVFESDRSGFPEIWVSDQDGKNARAVTHFRGPVTGSPRWSPDGASIAFDTRADGQPEIYVVSVAGEGAVNTPRRLTYNPATDAVPTWSPDGRWIYFHSTRSGTAQIWRVAASGGEPTVVSPGLARAPVVSRDGRWVYFGRDDQAWRVPAEGGPEALVVKDALPRSFVPGRAGLWFLRWEQRRRMDLMYLDLATGVERTVAELSGRVQTGLTVSADETYALFTRSDEGTRDLMLVEGYRPR